LDAVIEGSSASSSLTCDALVIGQVETKATALPYDVMVTTNDEAKVIPAPAVVEYDAMVLGKDTVVVSLEPALTRQATVEARADLAPAQACNAMVAAKDETVTALAPSSAYDAMVAGTDGVAAASTPSTAPPHATLDALLLGAVKAQATSSAPRDWNADFQAACDLPSTGSFGARLAWSLALHRVSTAFSDAAMGTVVELVEDLRRAPAKRRFKPVNVGGVAGESA
jgi:hypothetical protein